MEIIVDAETKNQAGRNIDTEKRGGSESTNQAGKYEGKTQPRAQADREGQENRYATQPGKRRFMDMATVLRDGNPSSARGHVSHLARGHKRHSQRECKEPKEQKCQNQTSLPAETTGISGPSSQNGFSVGRSFLTKRRKFVIIWLQELYIFRLAVCKCFQQQDGLACRHGRLISGIWRRGQNRAGFPGVLPALASE